MIHQGSKPTITKERKSHNIKMSTVSTLELQTSITESKNK